ncbi:MAG: S1/P1 Nuclease [Bacteroidetes bacterium]|nr:MAG: S1/P1 Nuclease [Bacteroidota bacterium]TAG85292.1 MAG: S1/P1 Nuclease [Bacteroidota bacterium]
MKIIFFLLILFSPLYACAWGFFGHQRINRLAVFTLPPEMLRFYKYHISYLTENSVNPDKRRYAVKGEAPRHYIDVDIYNKFYNDSAVFKIPRYWNQAVEKHTEDTLQAYGIVPWHVNKMRYQLIEAFKQKNIQRILRLSADLGHYIGDANVPLHTTENYNGQLTNQIGIHGLWESRLVELFSDDYDFFVGQAVFLKNPQLSIWESVTNAHLALDSVLKFEKELSNRFPLDKKYAFEERNSILGRTYSLDFSKEYHQKLNGQVERQMRAAIKMVGNFWFTCWVEAGQPDLDGLLNDNWKENEKKEEDLPIEPLPTQARPHEGMGMKIKNCCENNSYLAYYRKNLPKDKNKK